MCDLMSKQPPYIIDRADKAFNNEVDLSLLLKTERVEILNLLYRHGALLFRGYDIGEKKFEEVVRVLTPNLLNYKGGDTPRTKVSNAVYTSTELPPHVKIPMHHEMSYSNTYPSIIYFCCIKPAEEGGETPLLDSRELYKLLSKDLIDRFKTNRLAYITNLHEKFGLGKTWSEYFEVESKEILNKFLEEKKVE